MDSLVGRLPQIAALLPAARRYATAPHRAARVRMAPIGCTTDASAVSHRRHNQVAAHSAATHLIYAGMMSALISSRPLERRRANDALDYEVARLHRSLGHSSASSDGSGYYSFNSCLLPAVTIWPEMIAWFASGYASPC
jgi:hypothetical protein